MTANGLGQTDVGKKQVLGGLNAEFYGRGYKHYNNPENVDFGLQDQRLFAWTDTLFSSHASIEPNHHHRPALHSSPLRRSDH